MNKEVISDRQAIVLIILYIGSTAALSILGIEAEQDFWICIILSLAIAILMAIIKGTFTTFTFPFGEIITFSAVFSSF